MTSLVQAAGVIEHKMETVANNLANVNTVGFKEDQPSFREVLSTVQRVVPESLEERFLSHEYLDDYVGMDKSAVIVDEVGKNFETGRMRSTGNDLDFAISNEGDRAPCTLLRISWILLRISRILLGKPRIVLRKSRILLRKSRILLRKSQNLGPT